MVFGEHVDDTVQEVDISTRACTPGVPRLRRTSSQTDHHNIFPDRVIKRKSQKSFKDNYEGLIDFLSQV